MVFYVVLIYGLSVHCFCAISCVGTDLLCLFTVLWADTNSAFGIRENNNLLATSANNPSVYTMTVYFLSALPDYCNDSTFIKPLCPFTISKIRQDV